jgi:hypothetical protein
MKGDLESNVTGGNFENLLHRVGPASDIVLVP